MREGGGGKGRKGLQTLQVFPLTTTIIHIFPSLSSEAREFWNSSVQIGIKFKRRRTSDYEEEEEEGPCGVASYPQHLILSQNSSDFLIG